VASAGRGFGPISTEINAAYSPDFFAASGAALFTGFDASGAVPGTAVSLTAGVGRQMVEDNAAFGTPDYTVWSAGASAELLGSTVGATLTGTNISGAECFGGSDLCRTRVIVGIWRGL
jgi:hypothetical protein